MLNLLVCKESSFNLLVDLEIVSFSSDFNSSLIDCSRASALSSFTSGSKICNTSSNSFYFYLNIFIYSKVFLFIEVSLIFNKLITSGDNDSSKCG
jgi:hypothetical protein